MLGIIEKIEMDDDDDVGGYDDDNDYGITAVYVGNHQKG